MCCCDFSYLVGTKSDIREREVTYAETTFYAEWKGIEYVETSSKEDINVDKVYSCQGSGN